MCPLPQQKDQGLLLPKCHVRRTRPNHDNSVFRQTETGLKVRNVSLVRGEANHAAQTFGIFGVFVTRIPVPRHEIRPSLHQPLALL
jgi:hypothetical protein